MCCSLREVIAFYAIQCALFQQPLTPLPSTLLAPSATSHFGYRCFSCLPLLLVACFCYYLCFSSSTPSPALVTWPLTLFAICSLLCHNHFLDNSVVSFFCNSIALPSALPSAPHCWLRLLLLRPISAAPSKSLLLLAPFLMLLAPSLLLLAPSRLLLALL